MSYIKLKDTTVLEFDLGSGQYNVIRPDLLPILLRDRIKDSSDMNSRLDDIRNYDALMNFFSHRVLSIKRMHAKKILNALHISQSNDLETIRKIMILCKALSITDDYWLTNDENEKWADVNLRTNPLHETIAHIALTGECLTVTGKPHTPELTGQGVYAKAWEREDGELYLYKASSPLGTESQTEVEVSDILDHTNVPHVKYERVDRGVNVYSKCKNMCNDDYSIVPAEAVMSWCSLKGKDFDQFVLETDSESFYKTLVVDYLIANSDRHGQNWGFYMDNHTGELVSMHPLYDHNNAFDAREMELSDGGDSLMLLGKSKLEAAQYALKRCDFKIIDIPENIFISKKHQNCFLSRANRLGINVKVINKDKDKNKLKQFFMKSVGFFKLFFL